MVVQVACDVLTFRSSCQQGDKSFLESAYRSKQSWPTKGLSAADRDALASIDCPRMRCEEAKAGGFLPTVCSTSDDCPRIRCWDYQEQGACKQGRICSKPSRCLYPLSLPRVRDTFGGAGTSCEGAGGEGLRAAGGEDERTGRGEGVAACQQGLS
jgi:hypothetical protein